ncbi:unnamed protein product [Somion occarium]|uniref:Transmembrane protein n=1 Tax=Somion occarium TaxID=3059160 RepID=A0ABP1DJN5_9APHY
MHTVVLRYIPHEHPPTDVPFELRSYYTKEVWESRLPAITRKASRYYKRNMQIIWIILLFVCSIGVPIALFYVALDHLPESEAEKQEDKDFPFHHYWHGGFDRYWKARLIALASWIAVMLLFYVPIITWKHLGRKNVNKQLKKWEKEDRASRSGSVDVPTFKLLRIGIFGNTIRLQVTLPASYVPVSSFHPAAHLPAYLVNGPSDPAAAYYYNNAAPISAPVYPQAPLGGYPAAPLTALSGIPLYNANDEKATGYIGGIGAATQPPHSAQSNNGNFEDVKV